MVLQLPDSSFVAWLTHVLAFMGGCFGCCTNPTPIIAVDEPSKGLRIQGRLVKKQTKSDYDFWSSTSTCDVDKSTVQSMISTSTNQTPFNHPEFVNQGLVCWNQARLQWIGSERLINQTRKNRKRRISWNTSEESLLGTKQPFPNRIPLPEMVEFLVRVWENEGLYG